MWTTTLTEYVFITSAVFVVSAREGACPSYYALNHRFDNVSCSIHFRLPDKSLDTLKYFGLYRFALRMGTDPVETAVVFHRCGEVD